MCFRDVYACIYRLGSKALDCPWFLGFAHQGDSYQLVNWSTGFAARFPWFGHVL